MPGAHADVLAAIGHTPIIRLNHVTDALAARNKHCEIYAKLEYCNPGGSVKDRIALNIILEAEREGRLGPGATIIEATSGNTGAGLAMIAATRGYSCIFVMPDKMSNEKVDLLRAYGAKVVLCPTAVAPEDPRSYYKVAKRLVEETPAAFYANQYHNPDNPNAHYRYTGPEIWTQTKGQFDAFVCGMGTGGTVSGCGRYFKERNPEVKIVGVDPVGSIYYEYFRTRKITRAFAYTVEGIGEDFLPSTMDFSVLDDVVSVDDRECFLMTRDLVRREGIFVGGSSGAAVAGAIKYALSLPEPKKILVLLPDGANRYLSKIFNDEWMRSNGYSHEQGVSGTVAHMLLQKPQPVVTVSGDQSVRDTVAVMREHGFSQVPVLDESGRHCGVISELDLLHHIVESGGRLDRKVIELARPDYATVTPQTRIELLRSIFNDSNVVLVIDQERLCGLLTKIDLIEYLASRDAASYGANP
jgi:cystathionine beta-synthase